MTQGRHSDAASCGPQLWEREPELDVAARALDDLCADAASSGSLVVYRGEAGIGKTALLDQVRRLAQGRATVWSARGGETVTSVPFNVVRQLLQPALLALSEEESREYFGDWYDIAGPALGIAEPTGRQADPQGVRDGLVAAVSRLARLHWPLVLLIDDAHWADLETLEWLVAFAERLDDLPVLVVVAQRDPEDGQVAACLDAVALAARQDTPRLRPLSPDATAGLTRATLGPHADDPFCREVWAVTGGNPYETVELLAKVQDAGTAPEESHAGELRALNKTARGRGLVTRLEGLGTEATRFAWAAAVLGTRIEPGLAALLAGMNPEQAGRCAERLRTARILTDGTYGDVGTLEFVHPLIATAVYQSIPPATRTAMHGQAAWAVTASGHGPAAASRHLLEVHPDDDPELVEQLRAAAREHLAVGAPAAARRCLERALEEPPLPELWPHVQYELGCATLLTSPATTVRHLRAALEATPGLYGEERVDAVCRMAQALVHNDQLADALTLIDTESHQLEAGPQRLRLQASRFFWESIYNGESDAPARSRRLADLAAKVTGRDNAERVLLILRAFDMMNRGENAEEVAEYCDRALVNGRLAPGLGWTDTEWSFEILIALGFSYIFSDRLDRAESLFAEGIRAYESAGWSGGHLAVAHAFAGYVHRRRGRLTEAEALLREALRLTDRVGRGLPMHWDAAGKLIDTLLARGRPDEALKIAERYDYAPPYPSTILFPEAYSVRGRLMLAIGRTAEGISELEAASKAAQARGGHNTIVSSWACDLARAVADTDPKRAADLAVQARVQAERLGTDTAIGEALRCAAALETGQRQLTLYAKAVTYLEASPSAYEHALARVEYGIAARSRAELNRGLQLARSCGAEGLANRAREVLETGRGLH
ncbi:MULTISPECIES: AAA family ATPase [unclassified Streptomyces]|uniref:ATP-binding protein n=1 Tax=unclassified Streptomyces TaxID=2593676 RepID=UPI000DB9C46D|nr:MULTISPECIES: AAA family ATPase [unclassified Streptomyces]MYT74462.1 AAA family ATPase [Streptomyces sp. SID8367]RAJ91441.1 AAA ATPase-like protein [Streptomyces sp. PsTaAH-137]